MREYERVSAFLIALAFTSSASSEEWWHGDYVWAESRHPCQDNDSVARYGEKTVEYWESGCEIEKVTKLIGLQGVILNLKCTESDEEYSARELLLKTEDTIASFPPLKVLRSCNAPIPEPITPPKREPVQTGGDCQENLRVYRSPRNEERQAVSFQELQFTTGIADGTVELTEYINGKPAWRAHGTHTCSNGAVICRLTFPQMLGDPVSLPYEAITNADGSAGAMVIPSFQQEVYLSNRHAVAEGKGYGGFVADLLNGFVPAEDKMLTPHNAYWFAGCKQP
jgi:hypothetical protein